MNSAVTWQAALKNKRFRSVFIISVLTLAAALYFLPAFLEYVETRPGISFDDPVLSLFTAMDLTWIIFAVIYTALFAAIFSLFPHPRHLLFAIQLYSMMVVSRIAAMYILPLEPPQGMIVLQDPFVEYFGAGSALTKDLFFSGHTASLLIFYFSAENRKFKTAFLLLTILIAVLVILQKVHYTIDIYAAIAFTTACCYILRVIKEKFNI